MITDHSYLTDTTRNI